MKCQSTRTFTLSGGSVAGRELPPVGTLTVQCELERRHRGRHVVYLTTDHFDRRGVVEWKGE